MARGEARARLPRRLPRLTAHTITSLRALWTELDRVRATGVGYDREEHHLGISSVSGLVTDAHGTTVAIAIVVPAARFAGREAELAGALRAAVRRHDERAANFR
jgi:DNA-binding IclR family transcriptional regulator